MWLYGQSHFSKIWDSFEHGTLPVMKETTDTISHQYLIKLIYDSYRELNLYLVVNTTQRQIRKIPQGGLTARIYFPLGKNPSPELQYQLIAFFRSDLGVYKYLAGYSHSNYFQFMKRPVNLLSKNFSKIIMCICIPNPHLNFCGADDL